MTSTRVMVLAALSDRQWRRTIEVAKMAGISVELAVYHLKKLERDGYALSRGSARRREWCWEPGGYAGQGLDSNTADPCNGLLG